MPALVDHENYPIWTPLKNKDQENYATEKDRENYAPEHSSQSGVISAL